MKRKVSASKIRYFSKQFKNKNIVIHTLKQMIDASKVPNTFLYMAMIESNFLTTAKSNKHAAGLWQLMPKTAKSLGLTINRHVDERLDPISSTKVAAKYLQYLHKRFHKWYLVAFAYNCGETKLARAIKRSGSDSIFTLLSEKKNYLPKETRRYVRKLIVASLLSQTRTITSIQKKYHKNKLRTLHVKKGTRLKKVARLYNIPIVMLKQYNAHILKGITPKGARKYALYIPTNAKTTQQKAKRKVRSHKKITEHTTKLTLPQKRAKQNHKKTTIKDRNKIKITKIQAKKSFLKKKPLKTISYRTTTTRKATVI
jgi:membrane-bound lytic murein transglycosylase D